MNNMTETTAFGEAFLRDWYRKIDGKAPFSELARLTVGEGLVVDFPNNPLDMDGFERWYAAQCRDFCGEHCIHSIKVTEEADAIVIFSEITWRAKNTAGEAIELTPNVTLRLDRVNRAVFYYGCVDRPTK